MDMPGVQEPVRVDSEAVISSSLEGGLVELRLARPEHRNALDEQMVDGLRASLDAAATDDGTRAVVLTGEGTAFCAGADLARFDEALDGRAFRFQSHRLTALTELLEDRAKPGLGLGDRNSGFEDVLFVGLVRIHIQLPQKELFPRKDRRFRIPQFL
jgi:hypothetical protein